MKLPATILLVLATTALVSVNGAFAQFGGGPPRSMPMPKGGGAAASRAEPAERASREASETMQRPPTTEPLVPGGFESAVKVCLTFSGQTVGPGQEICQGSRTLRCNGMTGAFRDTNVPC